jgi:serine/threonine-protein kinase HipA
MTENKFRKAIILFNNERAGLLEEIKDGYRFTYDSEFIKNKRAISVSLPITKNCYESKDLFSFFMGLLPEGWYLDLVCRTLKIDKDDVFGILLATCKDTIGAVTVREVK